MVESMEKVAENYASKYARNVGSNQAIECARNVQVIKEKYVKRQLGNSQKTTLKIRKELSENACK